MKTATVREAPLTRTPAKESAATGVTPALSCVGVVVASTPALRIRSGNCDAAGRRAAGCLLEPAVGDTVACLLVAPDELWVLAILQREPDVADVIGSDRPLTVQVPKLTLESTRFALQAQHATLAVDEGHVAGNRFIVVGNAIKLMGAALSSVFDRVTHFSKHHSRHTEGIDRVEAGHVECEAQQMLRLSAEHTLINGSKLIKARGGQIHFG